jgi:hypothetical protein
VAHIKERGWIRWVSNQKPGKNPNDNFKKGDFIMPEEDKNKDPDVTEDAPVDEERLVDILNKKTSGLEALEPTLPDDTDTEPEKPSPEEVPPYITTLIEGIARKIAKEEIGKALGHTVE